MIDGDKKKISLMEDIIEGKKVTVHEFSTIFNIQASDLAEFLLSVRPHVLYYSNRENLF